MKLVIATPSPFARTLDEHEQLLAAGDSFTLHASASPGSPSAARSLALKKAAWDNTC